MTAEDVLAILDLLHGAGIRVWLDGGWGVDALLGEQTRAHNDLDIVIAHPDLAAYQQVMAEHGFVMFRKDNAFNFVLIDPAGLQVDVHVVDLGTTMIDGNGDEVYGPNGLAYRVGALEGTGTILGRGVACCTPESQILSHTGYEIDADDIRDVLALHRRFALPLPPPYSDLKAHVHTPHPGVGWTERWAAGGTA